MTPEEAFEQLLAVTEPWVNHLAKISKFEGELNWQRVAADLDARACAVARELLGAGERLRLAAGLGVRGAGRPVRVKSKAAWMRKQRDAGVSIAEIARKCRCSRQSVYRALNQKPD